MKHFIAYLLFSILFFNCKLEKKSTSNKLINDKLIDTAITPPKKRKSFKENLIGAVYRKHYEIPEFKGYSGGGFLIGSEFAIEKIKYKNDNIKYLILSRLNGKDNKGRPLFKVSDLVEMDKATDVYKKFPNKEIVTFSNIYLNGQKDEELFALAAYSDADIIKEVYKVWRANRKTGKFEEITDLSNIEVRNDEM